MRFRASSLFTPQARRALTVFLFLPAIAQPPRVYFSISSDRTFAPGEKARVTYSSQNVDSLEFRVYRVNDPTKFFRQMTETHSFGGQVAAAPKARTLLERFHQGKQRERYAMRSLIRRQFGDEEHFALTRFFERKAREIPKGPGGDRYAEVPLLNPQQLVRSWRVNMDRKNPWDSRSVDFDLPGGGLYIVEATDGNLRAATIVNATPFVVLKKTTSGRLATQVVERANGSPIEGVAIEIIQGPADLAKATTNANGFADIAVNPESERGMMLLARKGADLAITPIEFWSLRDSSERLAMGYVYTDRPIYRPAHKVGYRAILRGESDKGWTLPDTADINCEINNPEGQTVDRRTLKLSDFGTVSGEWQIPANAPLGYYSIVLRAGESVQSGSFQVDEYRKPEYEVKVTSSHTRILQGETAEFRVSAVYFFGEPVANAKLKYTVRKVRYWLPWWDDYEPDEFGEGDEGGFDYAGEQETEAETKLDAQGNATIRVPTKLDKFDFRYIVEAKVTDEARREVSGRGGVNATIGNFALIAFPDKYVYAPGETATLTVEARNYDGEPVPGVPFTVTLDKKRFRGTTGALRGTVSLPVPGAGSWMAEVTAASAGRTVAQEVHLWVSGQFRDEGRGQQITLVPDKKSYKPGDVAKVLVVTNVSDTTVLLGVEGRGLHKTDTRTSAATSFVYEVPILPEFVPNVFVTAAFVKDGKYFQGSKSLKVPPTAKVFEVEIHPSKPQFKPGEPASYEVLAKDAAGKPVEAEFSLGVVDEAIYGVERDTTPAIDKAFYGRIYDRVQTESSLQYYFYGQAGKRAMPIAQLRRGTLAQVKPPNPMDPRVRKAFPDTALWLATMKTGADGKATAKLQFPDSITAWRATARGVTRDTRVGGAINRVITRKDLILRVAAPRFLTQGDETTISGIVNNYLKAPASVNVQFEAQGVQLLDGKTRQGTAATETGTTFDFRVRATSAEKAVLTMKALSTEDSDALEIELPIRPYGVKLTEAHTGTLTDAGSVTQDVHFPANSNARAIEIRTMPSLAGAIFGGLEYLTTYPYGCTEQTLSSFVPNAVVQRAMSDLKLQGGMDRGRLQKKISAGLSKLADLQHPDGGWGFWSSDDSSAFMTANVVAALSEFGNWGRIDAMKAKTWLQKMLAREKRLSPDFLAFVDYGLSEQASYDKALEQIDAMTPYGLALLGLRSAGARAEDIASRLERTVTSSDAEAYWKCERDALMDIDVDASPEATAYAVKFLTKVRPQSPLLPKAARWLVNHRTDGYYWASTKQTAMVVYGLTDYVKRSGELDPNLQVIVKVNGENAYNKELTQADALAAQPPGVRVIPKTEAAKVEIATTGTGRLYWSVNSSRYEDRQRMPASRGDLSITRQYFRRLPNKSEVAFDGVAQAGDEVVSRLNLSGGEWKYLLIEDPIPAGGEWSKEITRFGWTHRELRDDRAAIFETYFKGSGRYESVIKLNRPGKYRVSPASVTPMYQPGITAFSDAFTVEVRP